MSKAPASGFARLLEEARSTGIPIILDGAVGTLLDDRGADTSPPLWSGLAPLTDPETLHSIHREYVEAGAQVTTACTFRTTRRAFGAAGQPQDRWREAAREAVRLARSAAADRALVAGSVGPLEDCFAPSRAPSGAAATEEHSLLCGELASAGVDLILLETFGTRDEVLAAAEAARTEAPGIPLAASLLTRADGLLFSGEDTVGTAVDLVETGASAILVNCVPTRFVGAALDRLLPGAPVPVGAYANLGRPEPNQGWTGSAHLSPDDYADAASGWVDRGCRMVGACCGSTPDHVAALARRFPEET